MDWVGDAKKLEIISYVIVVLSILYSITVVRDFNLYFKKRNKLVGSYYKYL